MELDYRKTFEIETINEFYSSIYAKLLNNVLNNNLDKTDETIPQVNLLNQLSSLHQINLFNLSLKDLEIYHEYLRAIKRYADYLVQN